MVSIPHFSSFGEALPIQPDVYAGEDLNVLEVETHKRTSTEAREIREKRKKMAAKFKAAAATKAAEEAKKKKAEVALRSPPRPSTPSAPSSPVDSAKKDAGVQVDSTVMEAIVVHEDQKSRDVPRPKTIAELVQAATDTGLLTPSEASAPVIPATLTEDVQQPVVVTADAPNPTPAPSDDPSDTPSPAVPCEAGSGEPASSEGVTPIQETADVSNPVPDEEPAAADEEDKPVVHEGIWCNGCGKDPIVGVLYHCLE